MNQLDIKLNALRQKQEKLEKEIEQLKNDPTYLTYKACENNADYMDDQQQDLCKKIQNTPPYDHTQYTRIEKEAKSYRNITIAINVFGAIMNACFIGFGIATGTFTWMLLACGLGLHATAIVPGKESKKSYQALEEIRLQQEHLTKYKEELKTIQNMKHTNIHKVNDLQNQAYPIVAQIHAKQQILFKVKSQILRIEEEMEQTTSSHTHQR